MAGIYDPQQFAGTIDEYQSLLTQAVGEGAVLEEDIPGLLEIFSQRMTETENPSSIEDMLSISREAVSNDLPLPFAVEEEVPARRVGGMLDQELIDIEAEAMATLTDPADYTQETLDAIEELDNREELSSQSFLQQLVNPYAYRRAGLAGVSGVNQLANLPFSLTALALKGNDAAAEFIMNDIFGQDVDYQTGDNALGTVMEQQRAFERLIGTTPPITMAESMMEVIPSAFLGGPLSRTGNMTIDFMADQTIRELTDERGARYETVFDTLGITNNDADPAVGIVSAMAIGIFGGTLATSSVVRLTNGRIARRPQGSTLRPITEVDPDGPARIMTDETAGDLTKAMIVDEQQALRDILRRRGIPNIDEIDARIEFDTHAAARTRVQEGLETGRLATRDADFNSPIAPAALINAYNALPDAVRRNVALYINLRDIRDDARIAVTQGTGTQAEVVALSTRIAQLENAFPVVREFSTRYNTVTASLRNFGEGSLFSPAYRIHLDATRPNYVPLEMSPVDPNAPFLQRIAQARRGDGEASTEPFFLNTRAIGTYDVNRRADPFEMLGQSVEATLTARMRNDTRLAIIDGLQNSPVGSQTIRLADDADDLRQQASRVIEVFRNGVRERYLTSNLTAQLMQFDPYIAQYPALFIPKRIFETSVVGPITMFAQIGGFAPVTAIRDAIGGAVTRPQGLAAPTIRGTLAAIPEQLWAKAQGALSTRMQQGFIDGGLPLPTWLMDAPRQQRFADTIADSYARTLYHQANESGGFDASLMKNTIEIGTTALSEVGRTIREGTSGISIPGGAAALRRIGNMTQGMISLFNVIQDAPRYSAIRNTVRDGTTSVEEATGLARQLTGDVTKSGRVYSPDGRRLEADAVDQGVLNLANRPIGAVTEVLREGTPFFNPMIQGNRRLIQAIVEDPVGFNARAWLNIGLPSLAFYGWNEMLGQEYNDYAMQRRSARDVVMSQYIGIPGLPPERGIEIPLMHELLTFSAPFTRSLYSLTRGESQEEMRAAMSIVSETILSNSVEVSFPTAGAAVANIAGISAPDSIMRPSEGVYQIREDELGVLPENMEHLARTLFGSIADMSIDVANAMAGDMSFDTFYQEIRNNVLSRSAVVDGPLGVRPSNTMFGIPNARREAQWESVNNFRAVWDAHLNPDRHNEDGLETPSSADGYTNLQGAEVASEDLPYTMFGPEQIPEPINPLYEQIGEIIVENIQRNELGMSGLVRREQIYNKYLREIRDFNAGNGEALVNWQALVSGITPVNEETAKLQEMLTDNNIDISDYEDRIRLINLIESSRADIINSQGQLFDNVEATITEILREQGFEGEFDVTRHLDPNDPDPLGMAGQ